MRTVQSFDDSLLLVACEGQPSDRLGSLDHLKSDGFGVLRHRRERTRHERRPQARSREASKEAPAVHRALLVIH